MTASEWVKCEQPGPMLTFLRGKASDRQLRLFACACCRSVLGFVPVGPCREALEVAERFAEGLGTREELATVRAKAVAAATHSASWAACETANPSAMQAARAASDESLEHIRRQSPAAAIDEARARAGFLRDIVGDPFTPIQPAYVRHAARNVRVRQAAEAIHTAGRQEDWPILAVELERLGCPKLVVEHCRSDEPHVRGCWVVDLLLHPEHLLEASPEPTPTFEPLASLEQIRRAMANYLGPKKYRRFLRKGIANSPAPGRLARQEEWERFVALHPACLIPDDQYAEAFAICCVHGCKLVERTIQGFVHDEPHMTTPAFLQARATEFPHSHRELSEAGWEHRIWWCATCQEARERWDAIHS